MDRVVLDPGVLVSALITPKGHPGALWRAVVDERLGLVTCPHLLAELAEVLERPKFRRYVSADEARAFVEEVAGRSRSVPDPVYIVASSRDSDDDYLLALARAADARALVSGDRDLTEMGVTDPPVLTPAEAVAQLSALPSSRRPPAEHSVGSPAAGGDPSRSKETDVADEVGEVVTSVAKGADRKQPPGREVGAGNNADRGSFDELRLQRGPTGIARHGVDPGR